jgi:hypothetical protein
MVSWKQGAVAVMVVLLVVLGGGVVYLSLPYEGSESSIQSVEDDPRVSVETGGDVTVLAPTDAESDVGVVFYPGARVAPNAYYESLSPLVTDANATVYIPEMPLNIALLDSDAAGEIRAGEEQIETWIVGGHSLGGVAACGYAAEEEVAGLLMFASYCNEDVSDREMAVLSVTGSADTVLDREAYRASKDRLPPTTTSEEIPGMNHTQFGSYRGQRGDSPSPLSDEEAHDRLADVVVPWIEERSSSNARVRAENSVSTVNTYTTHG